MRLKVAICTVEKGRKGSWELVGPRTKDKDLMVLTYSDTLNQLVCSDIAKIDQVKKIGKNRLK